MEHHRLHFVRSLLVTLATLVAGLPSAGAAPPGPTPAATLLLPYFEVDLTSPQGTTTLFSVNNAGDEEAVAHVVLWTDWGIPTYSFDVVLAADDVQTINLRDLFATGALPVTEGMGSGSCAGPVTSPPLDPVALRLRHTGEPHPGDGLCYASGRLGPTVATGFVTVDVVGSCVGEQLRFPTEIDYFYYDFGGVPIGGSYGQYDNVLWGDAFYVSNDDDSAQGIELVHLAADPSTPEGETFYRLFSQRGGDERALLGSRYRGRFLDGGPFDGGTDLLLWLEWPFHPEPMECEAAPTELDPCRRTMVQLSDEESEELGVTTPPATALAFRWPLGDDLPATATAGFFELSHAVQPGCQTLPPPAPDEPRQAWVTTVLQAEGRYSVGLSATRIPPAGN